MKVWITRYALTTGIISVEIDSLPEEGKRLYAKIPGAAVEQSFPPAQFHTTWEAAVQASIKARGKKIASLKKQISNLEKLKF